MKTTKKAVKKAAVARKKKAAKKARRIAPAPPTKHFYAPVLRTLQEMGGGAHKREVISRIVEVEKYSEGQLEIHDNAGRSVIENRIQWARAVLVRVGYVVESRVGTWGWWELTDKGQRVNLEAVSKDEIINKVEQMWSETRPESSAQAGGAQPPGSGDETAPEKEAKNEDEDELLRPLEGEVKFEDELLHRLRSLTPTAFEHLCKRVLKAVGLRDVEVTRPSRDEGFDGTGTLEVNPFVTTSFVFECKRYKDTAVRVGEVRQLKGKISEGVAQKGAIITTSRFTKDAHQAAEQGNSPVELIDGVRLVQLMVKYRVGVREAWEVDEEFFSGFEKDEKIR